MCVQHLQSLVASVDMSKFKNGRVHFSISGGQIVRLIFCILLLHKNICCGYLLEVPCGGNSDVLPEHVFSSRNKKNIMGVPLLSGALTYLELCIQVCGIGLGYVFTSSSNSVRYKFGLLGIVLGPVVTISIIYSI